MIVRWLRKLRGHKWEYLGRYEDVRRCTRCGRRETFYHHVGKTLWFRWFEIYPRAHSPELCGGKKVTDPNIRVW